MFLLIDHYIKKFPDNVSFAWFMSRKGNIYRHMDGRKTLQFTELGDSYFIKIHTGVGWKEIFKNLFQLKLPVLGAKNEYLAINKLTSLGLDTMTLVSYGLKGFNPATIQSYVVTEDLVDTISLEDYCSNWLQFTPEFNQKRTLIYKVASMVRTLHQNGINHRDLYICHFLLKKAEPISIKCPLFLIDLHRVQIRSIVPERWLIKDLSALYYSALHIGLTKRDCLRFIKAYRSGSLHKIFAKEKHFWHKIEQMAIILDNKPLKN